MADSMIPCETVGCPNHCKKTTKICGACTRCSTCGMTEDPLTTVNGRRYCERCVPIICTAYGCKKMRKPGADYCKACRVCCVECKKRFYIRWQVFKGHDYCYDCRIVCRICGDNLQDYNCVKCQY